MEWDVLVDGTSIRDQVSSFKVEGGMDAFTYQMTLVLEKLGDFSTWDWHVIPSAPQCEIKVKPNGTWFSLGEYFIEKPRIITAVDGTKMQGVWGRGKQALLSPPFAGKISQTWTNGMMTNDLIEELVTSVGLTWSDSYNTAGDYYIYGDTFIADEEYPVDLLTKLADFMGARMVGFRDGTVRFMNVNYGPSDGDQSLTIQDADIMAANLDLEYPDFANRVKIYASGASLGYTLKNVNFEGAEGFCFPNDDSYTKTLRFILINKDGNAVNNETVTFSLDVGSIVTLGASSSNTKTVNGFEEIVTSSDFTTFNLSYPASSIQGIYPASTPTVNYASNVASIDGTEVTLGSNLPYCDTTLRVAYTLDGVASVSITPVAGASGTVELTADIEGSQASVDLYVDDDCNCPLKIYASAYPTSIEAGESSKVLAVVERAGSSAAGESILFNLVEGGSKGSLSKYAVLAGSVNISNETTAAYQQGSAIKVNTRYKIDTTKAVTVYKYTQDENNTIQRYGSDLFSSISGDTEITLTGGTSGDEVVVSYYCESGAIVTLNTNENLGTSSMQFKVRAFVFSTTEEPVEAFVTINATDDEYDEEPEEVTFDEEDDDVETGSQTLSQYSAAWCAWKLRRKFGESIQWEDFINLCDAIFIIVNDGYNPRAVLRSDARMAEVTTTSQPGLPGHTSHCVGTSYYDIWPMQFQKYDDASIFVPSGSFLYDDS